MSDTHSFIRSELADSVDVYQAALGDTKLHDSLAKVADIIEHALRNGHHVFWAGNGGSAADAQHLAAELLGKMNYTRPALSSVALTTNSSTLTAIGNDFGFDHVFSRQMDGLAHTGDVFVGISTSGTSVNIIKAMEIAKAKGCTVIGMCGQNTKGFEPYCDVIIAAPSSRTPLIQQVHILAGHIVCGLVELAIFPEMAPSRQKVA